jgi:hypothetical protein
MNNRHATAFPASVLEQLLTKVEEARALAGPFITALTPAERHALAKMGDKTLAFVENAHEQAGLNPSLVPPYLNMAAFDADFADAHGLGALLVAIEQIRSEIDDTKMLAGSEAYQAALVFYNSVKVAAAQNVPGAKSVYEALRVRFPHGKHNTDNGGDTGGGEAPFE